MKTLYNILSVVALIVALAISAEAQTTNLFSSSAPNNPVFPINTMQNWNIDTILAGGITGAASKVDYTTNVAYTMGIPMSRYAAFSYVAWSTNASASGLTVASFDKSVGSGDWTAAFTLTNTLSGTNIISANTNIDTGGYILYRLNNITNVDASYSAFGTVGFSSKKGI